MSYAADQASALADIREAGAAITFTQAGAATQDATTETFTTATASTVSGYAVDAGLGGFEALALTTEIVALVDLVLLFAPSTAGQVPALNSTCSWGGLTRSVKARKVVSPDGTSNIVSYVGLG